MWGRRIRFGLLGIGLIVTPLSAQTAQQGTTTITSSTELIMVPAVVTDKSGTHVFGLTKEDFVLRQDGKPHAISIFEDVRTSSTRLHRSEGDQRTFSNVDPRGSDYHRLSIIVLDLVNTPFIDQSNARAALLKFLNEIADSDEPMCLLLLTSSGLTLLHDFTDDPRLLAIALNKASGNTAPLIHEQVVDPHHPTGDGLAAAITALIRGQLQSEAHLASLETRTAASITVECLQQIARAFRGMPGRKSLVWASSGFPFSLSSSSYLMCEPACPVHQRQEMQSSYDNLWRLMNDAQIAIYSVDLRATPSDSLTSMGGIRPSDLGDPQFDTSMQAREQRQDTSTTLRLFAETTGGKAFIGGNNLIQSFHQAVEDDTTYYLLGYYVSPRNTRSGWHEISLTVQRKGAQIRYRKGFFLSRDASPSSARQDIQLALNSPIDYTGMPISVTWSGEEPAKVDGKRKIRFDLIMSPNFAVVDESDDNHMVIDIVAVVRNPNGDRVSDLSQRIDVHLKSDGLEQIEHNGMTYRNTLLLPPGDYRVRFVVRDSLGNRMGSVAAPIAVAQ